MPCPPSEHATQAQAPSHLSLRAALSCAALTHASASAAIPAFSASKASARATMSACSAPMLARQSSSSRAWQSRGGYTEAWRLTAHAVQSSTWELAAPPPPQKPPYLSPRPAGCPLADVPRLLRLPPQAGQAFFSARQQALHILRTLPRKGRGGVQCNRFASGCECR